MTRKVARAVPVGRRWGGGGVRSGSKRLWGNGGRFNGTHFWNIRYCGTLQPDREFGSAQATMGGPMGLRTRWRHPLLPPCTYLPGSGAMFLRMWALCLSHLLSRFLLFFPLREGFFFPTLISFPLVSAARALLRERREEQVAPGVSPDRPLLTPQLLLPERQTDWFSRLSVSICLSVRAGPRWR